VSQASGCSLRGTPRRRFASQSRLPKPARAQQHLNPWGSTIAVYFLVTGITGLSILGIDTFVQDLFYGGALVLAATISQLVGGREERL
jgi:hypothetical protein